MAPRWVSPFLGEDDNEEEIIEMPIDEDDNTLEEENHQDETYNRIIQLLREGSSMVDERRRLQRERERERERRELIERAWDTIYKRGAALQKEAPDKHSHKESKIKFNKCPKCGYICSITVDPFYSDNHTKLYQESYCERCEREYYFVFNLVDVELVRDDSEGER